MKKLILLISLLLPISLFLSACGNEADSAKKNDSKLMIYTTIYPLAYFTERIGGDFVSADSIYPAGADEHTFEPSQKDMMKLADADLFIYIGLGLEGFVNKAKDILKNEDVSLVAAGEHITFDEPKAAEGEEDTHAGEERATEEEHSHEDEHSHEEGHSHEGGHDDGHHHGDIDPHVWLDPLYAKQLAEEIKNALSEKLPEQKSTFEENYQELAKELDDLHHQFEKTIHSAKRHEIIVSHAAYGYWEKRYGLEQISISGLSTTNEPSQKELEKIIAVAKEHNLKYVLVEQNFSSKLSGIVQREIGGDALTLHNLATLTDEDIKNNETYFTLMKKNIETLKKALNEKFF
ncbi:Zinc-binding protein adcA [Bacillus methanolicus PB1]|uniref:Zinc-binding protein adcA n=1 Tax=Bacillus methanolicus PB1 TaxID=997296 RepID=I3DYN0_BACMT|nr:zinc ABC transporter substrate-binding protein [Bacillus methanolicus]EIJ79351.1 Zinc-binding protein adcA [Bacillus methanolicus PB1]